MYSVVVGDTYELISRKVYGTEQYAGNISQANPGINEPLSVGALLIIPSNPDKTEDKSQTAESNDIDEVALKIETKRFRFWTGIRLTRRIDSIDTLEVTAPFESQLRDFRETFRPFSYKATSITVGSQALFKGVMVSVTPVIQESKTVQVGCYSVPGVLNDCTAPASSYPIEFNNQSLKEISTELLKPFGISVVFEADAGAVFSKVALEYNRTILDFLSDLAKQRNLIISSTANGALLFRKAVTSGTPVAVLRQGESPVISVTASFNPQEYYSHITGVEPVSIGLNGGVYTSVNEKLNGVLRPFTFQSSDSEAGTLKDAVDAKIGRMFGNMVAYEVSVNTWRDPKGELWKPNTLLSLQAEDVMIYQPYVFLIRSVELSRDENSKTAVLNVVLPGAFSGEIPERLPWDE